MSEIPTIPTLLEDFFPCYFIDGSSPIESSQRSTFLLRCTCETGTDAPTPPLPSRQTASFFSFPFFPSLSHSPSLLGTFQAAPLLHLLLFTFSSPPQPRSLSESGRPRCRHSPPGDYRHKGGLGGHGCSRSTCNAIGERERRKVPPPRPIPFSPPSSPPPQMMKTLSVWIRKERCVSVEGITVIKAVAQDLYMSTPLSTYSLFVTLYQFWDSEPFHAVVTLPNCCYAFDFFLLVEF